MNIVCKQGNERLFSGQNSDKTFTAIDHSGMEQHSILHFIFHLCDGVRARAMISINIGYLLVSFRCDSTAAAAAA